MSITNNEHRPTKLNNTSNLHLVYTSQGINVPGIGNIIPAAKDIDCTFKYGCDFFAHLDGMNRKATGAFDKRQNVNDQQLQSIRSSTRKFMHQANNKK